eukprot:1853672-Rhodomonas_salina.1
MQLHLEQSQIGFDGACFARLVGADAAPDATSVLDIAQGTCSKMRCTGDHLRKLPAVLLLSISNLFDAPGGDVQGQYRPLQKNA